MVLTELSVLSLDVGFSSGHPLCCLFKSLKRKKKKKLRQEVLKKNIKGLVTQ